MRVAGVMSGTSADGIDVVIAEITGTVDPQHPQQNSLHIQQLAFESQPWPNAERALIFHLFSNQATPADLCRANFVLGEQFAKAILSTIEQAGLTPTEIDLIGCHGQTIWHDVAAPTANPSGTQSTSKNHVTSTLQIGEPAVIAARTGITTVSNFRTADIAVGGQGAPLTATFDWYLLRPQTTINDTSNGTGTGTGTGNGWRAVQNIGGIGNVTLLPPTHLDAQPLAFDTGPGNVLIDWAAAAATAGQMRYDVDGRLAAQGHVHSTLLETWLSLPYFQQPPPKTTGREQFSQALAETWQRQARAAGADDLDLVATLTEVTAASIADAYAQHAPGPIAQVVVGGGGANNPTLMERLRCQLAQQLGYPVAVCTHAALGIDGDAKEALAFALLAYLTIHGLPGNVPSCTGAARPQILGQITPGVNFR